MLVPWYIGTNGYRIPIPRGACPDRRPHGRRLLKVLKAFAEYHDLSLGDLLEGIVLHAFDGKTPFSQSSLERIHELKRFYGLDLDSSASHRLTEIKRRAGTKAASEKKK